MTPSLAQQKIKNLQNWQRRSVALVATLVANRGAVSETVPCDFGACGFRRDAASPFVVGRAATPHAVSEVARVGAARRWHLDWCDHCAPFESASWATALLNASTAPFTAMWALS